MASIQVEDSVFELLYQYHQSGETISDTLKRLLSKAEVRIDCSGVKSGRFNKLIIHLLTEAGGSAKCTLIRDQVEGYMKRTGQMSSVDLGRIHYKKAGAKKSYNEPVWWNRVRADATVLREAGIIKTGTGRGNWELA